MPRLALVLAVALLTLRAPAASAEPLDVDLSRLGAPDPTAWTVIGARSGTALQPGQADTLAREAKQRFAVLSSEVALALSAPILAPASTTGHAGFDVALEGAYAPVHGEAIGEAPPLARFTNEPWATRSQTPHSLTTSGVHVRKALPFSFEFGGRLTYLAKSSYFAAQGEAKWALNEGFRYLPDLGLRVAHTKLFGQRDWNLGATDLDLMVSKRWGVNAVTSFTPYLAARFTFVSFSSEKIDFWADPDAGRDAQDDAVASFPHQRIGFYRTTLGVRMTAHVVSLAAEATYFGGKDYAGNDAAALPPGEYGDFEVDGSFSGAVKLGWEF